jgi:hypothetical protein
MPKIYPTSSCTFQREFDLRQRRRTNRVRSQGKQCSTVTNSVYTVCLQCSTVLRTRFFAELRCGARHTGSSAPDLRYIVLVRPIHPLEIFLSDAFWVQPDNLIIYDKIFVHYNFSSAIISDDSFICLFYCS